MTTQVSTKDPGGKSPRRIGRIFFALLNLSVLILSVLLIVFISIDTFEKINFLESHSYMTFQLWVCIFFILDFFIGLFYSANRWHFFRNHLLFLLLSIPYLNIINILGIHMSYDTLYFVRFIPLARGALALSIVTGYVSNNAVTSLFLSYIFILLSLTYFCSLIFYHLEYQVNPEIHSYWTGLWWAFMNMSTVGCNIQPVTVGGKIIAVILPIAGMIMFPLFTVYLTDFVTRKSKLTKIS